MTVLLSKMKNKDNKYQDLTLRIFESTEESVHEAVSKPIDKMCNIVVEQSRHSIKYLIKPLKYI